jgi:uncharacterized protein YjdB
MRRALLALGGALLLTGCSEGLLRETAPLSPAQLAISASVAAAGGAEQAYAKTNRLHIRFTKDGVVRFEETRPFDASGSEARVPVDVPLQTSSETLLLAIELLRDGDAVFRGGSQVTLRTGQPAAVAVSLDPVLARMTCSGEPLVLDAIGATDQLGAAALFVTGDTIVGVPITWTSENEAIISVTATGLVRSVSEGETTVRCAAEGVADTRLVRVAATAATIDVTPAQASIERGATQPLSAAVRDRLGTVLTGRSITWTSVAPAIATVSPAGVVTGVSAGSARIDARAGDAIGSMTITVRNRAPVVVTGTVQVAETSATLSGSVHPQGIGATAWFEYGTSPALDGATATAETAIPAGEAEVEITRTISGLAPGGTYFYRVAARNEVGTTRGSIREFRTPIAITISPTSAATQPGGQVSFTATVTGSANRAVTWTSSNTTVATIDAEGIATAHAVGSVIITATAAADPTRQATATLTVDRAAAAGIDAIVSGQTGQEVDPAAVSGPVTIRATVSAGAEHGVRRISLFVGDVEVCRETFAQPLDTDINGLTIDCGVDTAEASDVGVPRFRNVRQRVHVAAFDAAGDEVVSGEFCPQAGDCGAEFANVNTIRLAAQPSGVSATDAAGRTWWRAFTVSATPVIYTAGDHAAHVTVSAVHPGGAVPLSVGPLSQPAAHTFDFSPTVLAGLETVVQVQALVTTAAGATLEGAAGEFRIDARPPQLTALSAPQHQTYVRPAFQPAVDASDAGVGWVSGSTRFDVVSASDPAGPPVPGGADISSFAGVAESLTAQTYALRVTLRDALGNSATYFARQGGAWGITPDLLLRFGIDNTLPIVAVVDGPPHNSTNYGESWWTLSVTDPAGANPGSGINPASIRARLVRHDAQHPGGVCVNPTSTQREIISLLPTASSCFVAIDPQQLQVSAPLGQNEDDDYAYFVMTAYVDDNAGNRSPNVTRTTLWDWERPVIGEISAPASIVGGQAAAFSALVTDNVDLGDVAAVLGFSGDTAVWLVQGRTQLGSYGLPLTSSVAAPLTVASVIRSITETWDGGFISDLRSTARWLQYVARDQAELQMSTDCSFYWECEAALADISGAVQAGLGAGSFRDWQELAQEGVRFIMNSPVQTGPSAVQLTADLRGPSGFSNPFQRVLFYLRRTGSAGHRAEPIGTGTMAVFDAGDTRTYRFSLMLSAAGIPNGGYDIFAVGVDGSGDALMTETVGVIVDDDEFVEGSSFMSSSQITAPAGSRPTAPARSR